jgi:hypothetical protein
MKAKWFFRTLTVVMLALIFSISQGADKFYYGSFHAEYLLRKCPDFRDSLRFNIVFTRGLNENNIDSLAHDSLQGVAEQPDFYSPTYQSCISHYTLWETEGLQGSYYQFSYNGGTLVDDTSASGGKAKRFSPFPGSRLIQWGPTYEQEPGPAHYYTAEFCLKFISAIHLPNPNKGGGSPIPVCSLMVVDTISHSILKDTTLYRSDFVGGGYKTFTLKDYSVPQNNRIEFQIYLFGALDAVYFYVDYVKAYDDNGNRLMSGQMDQDIKTYVNQDWVHTTIPGTGDTVVYRWYLRDQPHYIDCYQPFTYIDSLLRSINTERVRFQTCKGK